VSTLIDFGRDVCGDLGQAEAREWLVTNGLGGYASGTVAGLLTRRYHGLLVAALKPPVGRTLLVAKLDETAESGGRVFSLYTNRWRDGSISLHGYRHLERFRLEDTVPVWTYALADDLLEKRVWMEPGANTTYVRFELPRGSGPVAMSIKALVNYRDHHGSTRGNGWQMRVTAEDRGLSVGGGRRRMTGTGGSTWPRNAPEAWKTTKITCTSGRFKGRSRRGSRSRLCSASTPARP